MDKNKDQLEELLKNELVCFKEILYKTQEVNEGETALSTKSLVKLLGHRDTQIGLIKKLEKERKILDNFIISDQQKLKVDTIKKEIKYIALKLVEIDAKMLDYLAMKKEEIIKELSSHTDSIGRDRSIRSSRKQIIDITLD
ncbi:MAG TPA: hypothetical protein QGH56_04335 [Candidatus Marinimicrobia bacterium]|jgi:hypothetical protein|nr:hypothetical protein [Candidatus Neomarinimicrobiota bacterium]|tara:strand:+ start:4012 stop:4434 length:423 start_codon:yes stop_codon:yes gene_type:complete